MKNVSGNCCIPFGLFGSRAPDHIVTYIEIINNKFIVTGDEIGQVIIWKINSLIDVSISWYLIGHSGKILNICNLSTNDCDYEYFATFSSNKEIAVWNCVDGRCIKFEKNIGADHLFVLSYKPNSRPCNLLLCCGKYPGIHVLDSLTLKVTMQLKSQGYPNWIQSLCAFEYQQAGVHVVLGLSVVGAAILWTIETLDKSTEIQIIYETESRMLMMLESPVAISMCPTKLRFVLVTSASVAQIYDAANWTLLCHFRNMDSCFLDGKFLDAKTILLQLKNGQTRLYRIPFLLDAPLDARHDLPMNLIDIGLLGTFSDDTHCYTSFVEKNELTVVSGCNNGTINLWRSHISDSSNFIQDQMCTCLTFSVEKQWASKNYLSVTNPLNLLTTVTCCHYGHNINSLIMGMDNGDIIVADMLQVVCVTLFPDHTSQLAYTVLQGHKLPVLVLLYTETPPSDDKKNPYRWLWSGSADFCVRLWDFEAKACVRVFHCHTGSVRYIVQSPMLGMTRVKHDGHIKANRNKEGNVEHEVLKPINNASWFGSHLFVSFDDDNGIAFLSLDTKRVVLKMRFSSEITSVSWRREHILSLIECADGTVTVWELGSGEMDRCVCGQVAKDLLESSTDKIQFRDQVLVPPVCSSLNDRLKRKPGTALTLHSLRQDSTSHGHILILDTEAILVDLYRSTSESTTGTEPIRTFIEAQLLLSLINHWSSDTSLDKTLERSLGLVATKSEIPSGHWSLKFSTISFQLSSDSFVNPILCSQKLLAGVAISQAMNSLSEKTTQYSWQRLKQYLMSMNTVITDNRKHVDTKTTMRQVCCLFATSLVTFRLPLLLIGSDSSSSLCVPHVQLVLQQFLQKYQDRCLEIRDAARTLFNASIDCLKLEQRTEIVQSWVIQSRILEFSDNIPEKFNDIHRSSLSSIYDIPALSDCRSGWALAELYDPRSIGMLQMIAIAFLAAIGSRYGSSDSRSTVVSNTVNAMLSKSVSIEKTIPGFNVEDYRLARITCGNLMRLLCHVPSSGNIMWPEMRRLAITFLGQGFPVWEPYLEVGTLFNKLLEIVSGAEKAMSGWSPGQLLTDEMDASRSAKASLLAIAIARPKVFATVLSIEVLRLQMQTANTNISNGTLTPKSSVAGISSSSALLSTSSSSLVSTSIGSSSSTSVSVSSASSSQPPLLAARHEVVEVIKVLCERKTREMHDVFPEIMDVLLACLNKLELRQYDLQQLFPPILLFRIASSHTASGKVCVGTRTGHVVLYDVKLGKYNTSPGHKNAVTSVTFSPDGKQVASYSMPDNSVCIWQLSSSGLFGMGSSHQVKLVSILNVPPVAVSQTVSDEDSSLLLWLEWYENRSIHLVTNSGLVNKIKL